MKQVRIILATTLAILLAACGSKNNPADTGGKDEQYIEITRSQFSGEGMVIGEPMKMTFDEMVRCTGSLTAKPSGTARISIAVPGIVSRIMCSSGQKVNTGEALFEISGNEFIELQKDFAETANQFRRFESEYKRIKSLFDEKVGSEKELIYAETEYKSIMARYSALAMKIKNIGLDAARIENGSFYNYFSVRSPLKGFISDIYVSLGQYADTQSTLAEVFDNNQIVLKLAVFEKDLPSIKAGQTVRFTITGDTVKYTGKLSSTGKSVDNDTKSITCLAELSQSDREHFINNAFTEAVIITRSDTVTAVPEEAIIRSDAEDYILCVVKEDENSLYLEKQKVEAGVVRNGYRQIKGNGNLKKLILRGAYNISAE